MTRRPPLPTASRRRGLAPLFALALPFAHAPLFALALPFALAWLGGCATTAEGGAPRGACVEGRADGVAVLDDGALVLAYRYAGLRVPAIDPLLAPGGTPLTRGVDPAEDPDRAHASGLWVAHGDVNGHDFWGDPSTRIQNGESVMCDGGRGRARIQARNLWLARGDLVLIEDRTVDVALEDGRRVIDLDLVLSPGSESGATFGDTRDGTLALRLHPALSVAGGGRLASSEGASGGDVLGGRARWVVAQGEVDGRTASIALLDHPSNPRHPTWWSGDPDGLLAANPFAMHAFGDAPPAAGALRLPHSESLRLRYRLILAEGRLSASSVESAWAAFARER